MRKFILTLCLLGALTNISNAYTPPQQARHDSILQSITGASFADGQPVRSILSFGALANGVKDCKPAFDKAMKAATKNKMGLHVIVPAGVYQLNGPIHLVNNVCLELQEGAVLRFSADAKYYLPVVQTSWEGTFCQNYSPFIYGFQLENVAIIGRGTIDGNAASIAAWGNKQRNDQRLIRQMDHTETPVSERNFGEGHFLRPQLIQLFGCKNVTLSDFFVTNSPFWCVHLLKCDNIICRALRYDAKLVNNDGLNPEMTRNVLIEEIEFNNGDDNVAIKAGRDNDGWNIGQNKTGLYAPTPSENIIVRNCRFKGLHGVVIGSEMSAGVQNVFVENCTSGGYCKRPFYMKTNPNRGGFIRDIYFQDCEFDEVEDLFFITSMYGGEGANDTHFTEIRDVHVENVRCNKANNAAIVLQGTVAKPLREISFKDVVVKSCTVGFSSMNTEPVMLQNCHLGGEMISVPSHVTKQDKLFDR